MIIINNINIIIIISSIRIIISMKIITISSILLTHSDHFDSQVVLSGPEGELNAEGLTFESPLDMRYTTSSVCNFSYFCLLSFLSFCLIFESPLDMRYTQSSVYEKLSFALDRCGWSMQGCGTSKTLMRAIGTKNQDLSVHHHLSLEFMI